MDNTLHTRRVSHILTELFSWPGQKAQVSFDRKLSDIRR